jgi:hypothetical protein
MTIRARRFVKVDVGNFLSYAAGQPVRLTLPRLRLAHSYILKIRGEIVVSAGAASGVDSEDDCFNLVNRLQMILDGGTPIKSLRGSTLRQMNKIRNGVDNNYVNPATALGTNPFEMVFHIPFEKRDTPFGRSFSLPTYRYESVELSILWGLATDIHVGGDRTLVIQNVIPELWEESERRVDDEQFILVREQDKDEDIPTSASTEEGKSVDLDLDAAAMRSIMVIVRDTASAVRDDDLVTRLRVKLDDEERADVTFDAAKAHAERLRRTPFDTGVVEIIWDRDGSLQGLPVLTGVKDGKLYITHGAATTSGRAQIIQELLVSTPMGR